MALPEWLIGPKSLNLPVTDTIEKLGDEDPSQGSNEEIKAIMFQGDMNSSKSISGNTTTLSECQTRWASE